ncbi:ABC transporter substrate-binding protein [Treponema sp.]|uniref:ABC transporter substrate-binding protein n=1 Tax=Treponema sp. TaxID=166 RepID=UPI0038910979
MKKTVMIWAAVIAASLSLGGCNKDKKSAGTTGTAQKVVRINFQRGGLCAAPVHVAWKMGLFDEELAKIGQKAEFVEVVEGGATLAEMIGSGKVDAGYGLYATQLQAMENGLPISYTSGIHIGCTKYYVKGDSPINSVADLRGKKIGVPGLADSSVMNLKRKLMDVGIGVTAENNEVEFLAYASSDLAIALDKGAVDVIGAHDPVATKGELAYGFKKILDTGTDEKFVKEYCCQQFVTHKLLKENPEGAAAVTRALQKASAFVEAEPRLAAQLQIENNLVAGDLDFNAALLDELNYVPSRSLGRKTFIDAARQLQEAGILKASTNIDEFAEKGYIELPGVPDGYTYDKETKTYKEIKDPRV